MKYPSSPPLPPGPSSGTARLAGTGTDLVEVLLLPLSDAGVHLVHEVVADLEVQFAALLGLHQGGLPGGLRGAVLRTWQEDGEEVVAAEV